MTSTLLPSSTLPETGPSDRSSKSAAPAEKSAPSTKKSSTDHAAESPFYAICCRSVAELEKHLADWQQLIANAAERNVFYEPEVLLPAWKLLHTSNRVHVVLVYRHNKRVTDPPILCGLFPLQQVDSPFWGVPQWRMLTNDFCVLATPLLHRQYATDAVRSWIDWTRSRGIGLLECVRLHGSGPVYQAFVDVFYERGITPFLVTQHTRAVLERAADYEAYQAGNLRGHNRRDMNRLRRRLEELGQLEIRYLQEDSQLDYWITSFLHLEQQGWKGEQGTALQQSDGQTEFFRAVLENLRQSGQLQLMGMFLDGEPIAMKCNLLCSPGSFAWKIAYDERFAKFSPGVQLEQENIETFHAGTDLEWMDSCAVPDHPMINRLWCDRRTITHLLIPTGHRGGELYAALRPLLRWFKHRLLRRRVWY